MKWMCLIACFPLFLFVTMGAAPPTTTGVMENSVGMKFRLIAAGEFLMGFRHSGGFEELVAAFPRSIHPRGDELFALDESPQRRVRITRPCYLGVHEVTVGQFRRFVEATKYRTTAEKTGEGAVGWAGLSAEEIRRTGKHRPFRRGREYSWKKPGFRLGEQHPVVCVSRDDARAFCDWLSRKEGVTYRLPTEAEWEYACRAGSRGWFAWGDEHRGIHRRANVGNVELEKAHPDAVLRQWLVDGDRDPGDGHVYTAPVGSFPANAWGLYDMHGNVWEWCQDRYSDTAYGRDTGKLPATVSDPVHDGPQGGEVELRVIRGGSWYTGPIMCRSASRGYFEGTDAACYVGFRVVRVGP